MPSTSPEPGDNSAGRELHDRYRRGYVLIEFDGFRNPSGRGTETYYNGDNQGEESRGLAWLLQRSMVSALRGPGTRFRTAGRKRIWPPASRTGTSSACGARLSACGWSRCSSPGRGEASLLHEEEIREALARGIAEGIIAYLIDSLETPAP